MHPPTFNLAQRLSDWPFCVLELRCRCSERVVTLPVRQLLERGDRTFSAVLAVLQRSECRGKWVPVYLVAGHHRTFAHSPALTWVVEMVPPPAGRLEQDKERI